MISNIELDEAAKIMRLPGFRGTFSKDELPTPMRPGTYIVNMENAVNSRGKPLPGSHWVVAEIHKDHTVYADPFGVVPPLEIIKRAPALIHWSKKQVEDIDSQLCGFYCLYFLYQRAHGRSWSDIMRDFHTFPETKLNRVLIDEFFGIKSA